MELVEQSAKVLSQGIGIVGMYKFCELVGNNSEDGNESSYQDYVRSIVESGDKSILEMGTVYLIIPTEGTKNNELIEFFKENMFSYCCVYPGENRAYVTTNYRVIVENDMQDIMYGYWHEPCDLHMPRVCVRVKTSQELVATLLKYRALSSVIGDETGLKHLEVVIPQHLKSNSINDALERLSKKLEEIEQIYFEVQDLLGWSSTQAMYFLPQGSCTTVHLCAFLPDWEYTIRSLYQTTTLSKSGMNDLITKLDGSLRNTNVGYNELMEYDSK